MKRLCIISILLILAIAIPAFAQEDEIQKTIRAYYQCIQQGDDEKLLSSYLAPEVADEIKKTDPKNIDAIGEIGGIAGAMIVTCRMVKQKIMAMSFNDLKIIVKERKDKSAVAVASYKGTSEMLGEKLTGDGFDEFTLKKIGESWKVERVIDKLKDK